MKLMKKSDIKIYKRCQEFPGKNYISADVNNQSSTEFSVPSPSIFPDNFKSVIETGNFSAFYLTWNSELCAKIKWIIWRTGTHSCGRFDISA